MKKHRKSKYILKAGLPVRILSILLAIALLFSAIPGMVGADEAGTPTSKTITKNIDFGRPDFVQDGEYFKMVIDGTSSYTLQPGAPMLPKQSVWTELPLGATDVSIEFNPGHATTIHVDAMISPAPVPVPILADRDYPVAKALINLYSRVSPTASSPIARDPTEVINYIDEAIYSSPGPYGDLSSYEVGVGVNYAGDLITYAVARITPCVYTSVSRSEMRYITDGTLTITYTEPQGAETLADGDQTYDLLILAPTGYIRDLQPLIEWKEEIGFTPKLVSLGEIYSGSHFEIPEWTRDNQEKIKYFIYRAILEWDITYVMAVGGWRTFWGLNNPMVTFPLRFSHNWDPIEPGYLADQYFSCCIAYDEEEGMVFDTWDSNENNVFAEWTPQGIDYYDAFPDVIWGRLAARNRKELRTLVDKIIYYEQNTYGADWFNSMLSVTGDGFQDIGYRTDNVYRWDITGLPDGDYTIWSVSRLRSDSSVFGPMDQVEVTIDRSAPSRITFVEDDHLKVEPLDEEQRVKYPGKPVAEIVIPSDEDVLGNTDVHFVPPEAYIGEFWAIANYDASNEILDIRIKSYDPRELPDYHTNTEAWKSKTAFNVWINNSQEETVAESGWIISDCVYEGEWEGQQALKFATKRIPKENHTKLWNSNGGWFYMVDVIEEFSKGYGMAYVNGHSSCMVYGDHFPGIPGGRHNGQTTGWATINMKYGLERYQASEGDPLFPLDQLTNGHKVPILLYSGCHSGQFDTSFMSLFYDPRNVLFGDRYATWTPEGVAHWIMRIPQGGSIATIGNGGLGSGYIGASILSGLTGWLFPRFFHNWVNYDGDHPGLDRVGDVHTSILIDYHLKDDAINDQTVRKHFEQFDLLGDPTLRIGGVPPEEIETTSTLSLGGDRGDHTTAPKIRLPDTRIDGPATVRFLGRSGPGTGGTLGDELEWKPAFLDSDDRSPITLITNETHGRFLTAYIHDASEDLEDESHLGFYIHPGFSVSTGGAIWDQIIYPTPTPAGHSSADEWTYDGTTYRIGAVCFDWFSFGVIRFPEDFTNYENWGTSQWLFLGDPPPIHTCGLYGATVAGFGNGEFAYLSSCEWQGVNASMFMFSNGKYVYQAITKPTCNMRGDSDGEHIFMVAQEFVINEGTYRGRPGSKGYILTGNASSEAWAVSNINNFTEPDLVVADGWAYIVVYRDNTGDIECWRSSDNGANWDVFLVTNNGLHPKVQINDDDSVSCYYVRGGKIYKSTSDDHGENWTEAASPIGSATTVDEIVYSPFSIDPNTLIFDKSGDDDDLYANIFIETIGVVMDKLEIDANGRIYTNITNTGTSYIPAITWTIKIEGDKPVAEFFRMSGILERLFTGKVIRGAYSGTTTALSLLETQEISIDPGYFGIGHVMITAEVSVEDELLDESQEDGFLLGGRLFFRYPEE